MHRKNHSPLCPPCSTSPHGYSTASQVINRNKKKKKKTVFLCFQSSSVDVVLPDKPGSHPTATDVFSSYVDKESIMFPKVVPVTSSLTSSDNEGDDAINCRTTDQRRKQGTGGCGICQALKAVLFKISLVKKIRNRRFEKKIANATNESSVASTYNREWLEGDVPNSIPKVYFAAEGKEGVGLPKVLRMPMASPSLADNEGKGDTQYWRNKGRRKLSRIFQEFLSETSLAKKMEKRKTRNNCRRNNEKFCEEDDEQRMNSRSDLTNSSMFTNSSVNSSVNSSSSSSSLSNSSSQSFSKRMKSFRSRSKRSLKANLRYLSDKIRTNTNNLKANNSKGPSYFSSNKNKLIMSESNTDDESSSKLGHDEQSKVVRNMEKNNNENKNLGCYKSMVSFCFVVMILLGLIFYGKLCAILCTSMWVVSVPLWTSTSNKAHRRKKFINGGLLARDDVH